MLVLLILLPLRALAIPCDCAVKIYSPTTGSHQQPYTVFKNYAANEFSSYQVKNQWQCRKNCEEKFQDDLPSNRLSAVLILYTQKLIEEGTLGYNCTGLTTLKFPVRVRARLGKLALGNVVDMITASFSLFAFAEVMKELSALESTRLNDYRETWQSGITDAYHSAGYQGMEAEWLGMVQESLVYAIDR